MNRRSARRWRRITSRARASPAGVNFLAVAYGTRPMPAMVDQLAPLHLGEVGAIPCGRRFRGASRDVPGLRRNPDSLRRRRPEFSLMRPCSRLSRRSASLPAFSSWVTITMVRPCACRSLSSSKDDALILGVEVAGGLVGQDDFRIVHERARDGDALLLAARKLRGQMRGAVCHADLLQRCQSFVFVRHAVEVLRQHHVFERREMRHQMELLEDEAHGFAAEARQFAAARVSRYRCRQCAAAPRGGLIEAADEVQQRGLAGTGGPHDGDPFAAARR